jgi:hypothetical protein
MYEEMYSRDDINLNNVYFQDYYTNKPNIQRKDVLSNNLQRLKLDCEDFERKMKDMNEKLNQQIQMQKHILDEKNKEIEEINMEREALERSLIIENKNNIEDSKERK